MKHTDVLVDGEWFAREGTEYTYNLNFDGKQKYFRRLKLNGQKSQMMTLRIQCKAITHYLLRTHIA